MVVDFLRDAGFDNAVNLNGGIDAWACDIDQSMPRYR
jgi:rhodanese-related sulfurtransferase